MITVHHLDNSRSQRILWLLEELGLDYEIKFYKRDPKTRLAPPELTAIHPLGKAPIVTDGDVTVAESGAIIEYLVGRYDDGSLLPAEGTRERLNYTYWLHYAEGSVMPLMLLSLVVSRIESAKLPFFARPIAKGIAKNIRGGYLGPNIKRHLAFIEARLGNSTWFCGEEMCAADIQMSFALDAASVRTNLNDAYPRMAECIARMQARPAYQAALEKGGPYTLMGGS
jgi:glutathione S-transferase